MLKVRRFSWLSLLLIFALILVACGGGDEAEAPAEEAAPVEEAEAPAEEAEAPAEEAEAPAEEMAEVDWAVMPGGFMEKALAGEFEGTEVTFDGPFADADKVLFEESVAPFEEATGININYIGDKEFEGRIGIAVDGGNPPDIADFPQPGLLAIFARQGHIVDPTTWMSDEWLQQQYNQSWLDMAMVEGADGAAMSGGTWYRFNGKSLVWYPKAKFDEAGYEIPQTWEELMALTQLIADDGDPAWCIGIESGAATGWAATDWTEEMMLRTTSLENYDAWVEGTLPFDSPEVRAAMEAWGEIWFNDDYVFGGTDTIVTTNFGDSPTAMFEDPPQCWMHKQGNFITGFFPEGLEPGVDWDFFYLPAIGDEFGKPFLVAGDLNGMFNDRPEVRAVMEYMTTPQSARGWLENGGALAAHQTATPEMYGQDMERGLAELVAAATSFRFDASDLMPGEVGAGSFWTGMTDYVSGAADLDTVLPEIDASWPEGVAGQVQEEAEAEEEVMVEGSIAVLLPDSASSARWEADDRRFFEEAFDAAGVEYTIVNAEGDARTQQTQAEQAITNGAKVLLLVNLDSGSGAAIIAQAREAGVKVIDYDRLTIEGEGADVYVSFDNVSVGRLMGETLEPLIDGLDAEVPQVVQLNGSPTDNNATLFREGYFGIASPHYDDGSWVLVDDQAVPDWDNQQALVIYEQILTAAGGAVDATFAANDGLAGSVIAALKSQGIDPMPVSGQDATVGGIQNILSGWQSMTVYKPIKLEAQAAADAAIALLKGEDVSTLTPDTLNNGTNDVPFIKLVPLAVTIDNIAETVIADGFRTWEEICVGDFEAFCPEDR